MPDGEQPAVADSGREGRAERPLRGSLGVLVAELAAGTPLAEAARCAGMSERTARRRKSDPEVASQVRAAREQMRDAHLGRLSSMTAEAITALQDLLSCAVPPTRLGAANSVIEYGLRFEERFDLKGKVDELEAAVAAMRGAGQRQLHPVPNPQRDLPQRPPAA